MYKYITQDNNAQFFASSSYHPVTIKVIQIKATRLRYYILWQGWDVPRGFAKDAVRMAGAVPETSPSEMLAGQGTDCLRGVVFWSIGSSGLLR